MASKLDLALDEVIKERRKETRGKRDNNNNNRNNGNRSDFGSRRNRDGGIRKRNNDNGSGSFAARSFTRSIQVPNRRNVDGQWSHDKFKEDASSSSSSIHSRLGSRPLSGRIGGGGNNINNMELSVENLHYDVTEKDLQELFSSVGDVQKARITFDLSGRSTGCAFVKYVNIEDAKKALEKFNDVLFDGQPMRIELKERERHESRGNRGGRNNSNNNNNNRRNGNGNGGRSFRGSRNRNSHNGGGRDGRDGRDKPNVTAEDLDREMESYMSSNNNDNNDMILD